MSSSSIPSPATPTCTAPKIKRTPSRGSLLIGYSSRKKRRVSVASFDFAADLGIESSAQTSVEETTADRFVPARPALSMPLNITPRTKRIAKSLGLIDDRIFNYSEASQGGSDTKLHSLLRKSASQLFQTPRAASSISAAANLGRRKHFLMALDGPGISRDQFATPMAWSARNFIAVAFRSDVYFQNLETKEIARLCEFSRTDGPVHAVDWGGTLQSHLLALGSAHGTVEVWDSDQRSRVVAWPSLDPGMGGIHWKPDVLAVGRDEGGVSLFDIRLKKEITTIKAHKRQVHGVKWSPDGNHLATGDDAGTVQVWDHRASAFLTHDDKRIRMKHDGPVKALSWSPWQSDLLATGGFARDGKIRIWNTSKMTSPPEPLHTISMNAAVTSLHWSPYCKELLSTHAMSWADSQPPGTPPTQQPRSPKATFANTITVHAYPSCEKVVSVAAHTAAIGHSCIGPDGCCVFTVSPTEENLKMFKIWSLPDSKPIGDIGMTSKCMIR
ncbi:WD40-repeat-containing domain protein [Hygrophoropsis aurantiaca]|uniref:WD40-repeat-containing domain protein n=1 Tax=Hygrophoropsis aurantiaca TaxID=72124 RepID=A0ACB8AEI7_9AGAM|nr:WD40-repeat-containing domain protein [Hygrophoropsis aurantiaca]